MNQKYPPPHHQIEDIEKMISLVKHYPLGMLVSAKNGTPYVTHIPIIYNEESKRLVAHIDKYNPQVETLVDGAEVTVVFKGPDTYISPSVYSTTQLPTWNYLIVHVTGIITRINDPEAAKDTMIAMTEFLEGKDQKFVLEKDNPRMEAAVPYIQAFDITITHWEGKFKLSQDKNKRDQALAKQALIEKSRDQALDFIEDMYS
ncbi:FMN-binding negative transcriptional regulator [Aureisphaera galaxeae]|uniref:FMN-binding negative transcriptional regulator n=1 Tax=Aureisphaera galaxeae TaxID=1538023 RepID=UPI0023501C0A|nr:FMN-binding negative transcriptional regulator [Aureisphaera galaxeae]MDC8005603.1 FMN-binding negative transcriptional regulator [Aureisphaera galaxeae]